MPHFSRQTIAIIAMMLIIIVPAAANASDHDTEETKTTTTTWEPRLSFWFDDDLGILVFGPTDPTAEEALDCTVGLQLSRHLPGNQAPKESPVNA